MPDCPTEVIETGVVGLFAFIRRAPTGPLLCLFNMTERWLHLPEAQAKGYGISQMHDALSDADVTAHGGNVVLPPYARVWLS